MPIYRANMMLNVNKLMFFAHAAIFGGGVTDNNMVTATTTA